MEIQITKPMPVAKAYSGGMSEPQARRMATDLANALSMFAQRGIVHQAVKTVNVFITPDGDFWLGAPLSKKETNIPCGGDLACMCPEMYWGASFDSRADVYSLGILLYTMLNEGRLPLTEEGASMEDVKAACLRRLEGAELPPPKNGSAQIQQAVLKACAYEPSHRFADFAELKEAFRD